MLSVTAAADGGRRVRRGGPGQPGERLVLGYAGKKGRSAFPFVRMAALVECGTHAVVAAEIAKDGEGEETLTRRILSGSAVGPGMVVMADSGLYSYANFRMAVDSGADALFRVGANLDLPALEWFPDGSYLSYIADSPEKARNNYRLRHGLVKLTDLPGIYVRARRLRGNRPGRRRGDHHPRHQCHRRGGCPSSARSASSAATLPGRRLFPPRKLEKATREAIDEIAERPNPPRRERTCPRAVKRFRHNSYPQKIRTERNIMHDSPDNPPVPSRRLIQRH